MTTVQLYPGASYKVVEAGLSTIAIYGPTLGGFIWNPSTPIDQGLPEMEVLYVDCTGPALTRVSATTVAIQPGQYYRVPPNTTLNIWVNSVSAGHLFTAITLQPVPQFPPTPTGGAFPPSGPTGLTKTIPSYLYVEYQDDDDLQSLVMAYNAMAQAYVDWFNSVNLPIYTGLAGGLLDWVAQGLYGIQRQAIATGQQNLVGPLNTFVLNEHDLTLNAGILVGPINIAAMSDDVFQRVITWHFYKGDGKYFNVLWLKRRVYRFLYGTNGTDTEGPTDQISVSFGNNGQINITIITVIITVIGGPWCNGMLLNSMSALLNEPQIVTTPIPAPLLAQTFKACMDDGILAMPWQFQVLTNIGS